MRMRKQVKNVVAANGGSCSSTKPRSIFFNTNSPSKSEVDVTEMLKEVEKFLPNELSKKQKLEAAKQIKKIWDADSNKIITIANTIDENFQQKKADSKATEQKDSYGVGDFIKQVMNLLLTAKMGPLFAPVFMAASAAAQDIGNLIINSGQPQGGADLCSQVIANIGCAQGYITNSTNPWVAPLPQFNRVVSSTNGAAPNPSSSAYMQLRDCVTINNVVGPKVAQAYIAGPTPSVVSCTATSTGWLGYQVQATAQGGISSENCLALQNQLQVEFQNCQSLKGALLKGAEIAGIVVGGVAALALCVCAFNYCKAKRSRNNEAANAAETSYQSLKA